MSFHTPLFILWSVVKVATAGIRTRDADSACILSAPPWTRLGHGCHLFSYKTKNGVYSIFIHFFL